MILLDLETYALDAAAQFIEPPTAPANYRDEAKILAYVVERTRELIDRCALDPDLCRIVAIGMDGRDFAEPCVHLCKDEGEERKALAVAWGMIRHQPVVGFNILSFDLPVMIRRSQYLGLAYPTINLDRYRTNHVDLMERLSFNGKIKAHSLDFYARRFDFGIQDAVTAKDVDALVAAGNWEAVQSHCLADLQRTRRLAEQLGIFSATEVDREQPVF